MSPVSVCDELHLSSGNLFLLQLQ